MTFNVSEIKAIQEAAKAVIDIVTHQAAKVDCLDNAAYCASEIIALTEWCSASIAHNKAVAGCVLTGYDWPQGVSVAVKADFGMPY